jgi:hypothetical protein
VTARNFSLGLLKHRLRLLDQAGSGPWLRPTAFVLGALGPTQAGNLRVQRGSQAGRMREQLLRTIFTIPRQQKPNALASVSDFDGQEAETAVCDEVPGHFQSVAKDQE